jgi:hypothetical protein
MDADSVELMVVSTTNPLVEKDFIGIMNRDERLTSVASILGESSSKDASLPLDTVDLE